MILLYCSRKRFKRFKTFNKFKRLGISKIYEQHFLIFYSLFFVSYSLIPPPHLCVFAPLRALRETRKSFKRFNVFNKFKRLGISKLFEFHFLISYLLFLISYSLIPTPCLRVSTLKPAQQIKPLNERSDLNL